MCLTMRLCCSSASEDLGCRRGDFSRKHYGSVELVSPTHNALICLLLSLCLSVTDSSSSFPPSSLLILLIMISPPFLPLSVISFPSFLLAWTDNRGGLMSHDILGVVQQCALPEPVWITMGAPLTVMPAQPLKFMFCFDAAAQCVSLWLITKLLSHCCFGELCVRVHVPPL